MFIPLGFCGLFTIFVAASGAHATDLSDAPVVNPIFSERAEQITKRAMHVLKEEEGVVSLTMLPGAKSLANKTKIVFFRRKLSRVEVIANGEVTGEHKDANGGAILVDIDRDTIIKYPQVGDYAVPMSDPNADSNGDKKDQFDYLVPEEKETKEKNTRPGYLEFGLGIMQGTTTSSSSTPADQDLSSNGYRFQDMHLAYYSDLFPIGIEMNSHSGNFPTGTFVRTVVASSESVSNMEFGYRFKPFFGNHVEPVLKLNLLSETFTTNNPTSDVISTKTSGMGFGLRLNYNLVSPIWKPEKAKIGFALQQIFGEFFYYPSITATDTGLTTRGTTSTGSTGMQYRLGFTTIAYFGFIPFIKRFIFQGSYGARLYHLKFQGPTTLDPIDTQAITQNNTSSTTESDFRFFVGIRIEDPVRMVLGSSDTQGEKQEKQ